MQPRVWLLHSSGSGGAGGSGGGGGSGGSGNSKPPGSGRQITRTRARIMRSSNTAIRGGSHGGKIFNFILICK